MSDVQHHFTRQDSAWENLMFWLYDYAHMLEQDGFSARLGELIEGPGLNWMEYDEMAQIDCMTWLLKGVGK